MHRGCNSRGVFSKLSNFPFFHNVEMDKNRPRGGTWKFGKFGKYSKIFKLFQRSKTPLRRFRCVQMNLQLRPPAMGPLKYQKKSSFPRQLLLYFLFCMCPASLKFENEAHLGHINFKMRPTLGTSISKRGTLGTYVILKMMPTSGTSGPQRQVLSTSASKDVNSSVGLCFFVATYRNDLISVGGHKKNTDRFFCSHSVLPTIMTY